MVNDQGEMIGKRKIMCPYLVCIYMWLYSVLCSVLKPCDTTLNFATDNIEVNVEHTAVNVVAGNKQLDSAVSHKVWRVSVKRNCVL